MAKNSTAKTVTATKAYSYLRFSTPEQLKGDSKRRQLELSRKFALKHNLDIDESLTFHDLGVSAFHGKNVEEGALGAFIEAVDRGIIPKGSWLLVESLDRLSRDKVLDAFTQFSDILKNDITIATMQDNKIYTHASVSDNFGDLMISLGIMQRAHEESKAKSLRIKEAWQQKRKNAVATNKKITGNCPSWLKLNKDTDEFESVPEHEETINRIFRMALDGIGKVTIARTLNKTNTSTFGRSKAWYPTVVQKLLQSPSVIGRFQPMQYVYDSKTRKKKHVPEGEPIDNYFPPIIEPEVFFKVKQIRELRLINSGPRGKKFSNLLTRLTTCGNCGGSMNYVRKTDKYTYLVCANARRHMDSCRSYSWSYDDLEVAVLESINKVNFTELFPDLHTSQTELQRELEDKIIIAQEKLRDTQERLDNTTELLTKRPDNDRLLSAFDNLEGEEVSLKEELEALTLAESDSKHTLSNFESDLQKTKEALQRMDDIMANGTDEDIFMFRSKLHQLLRRNIEEIQLVPAFKDQKVKIWLPNYPQMIDSNGNYVNPEDAHTVIPESEVFVTEKECTGTVLIKYRSGSKKGSAPSQFPLMRKRKLPHDKDEPIKDRYRVREEHGKFIFGFDRS